MFSSKGIMNEVCQRAFVLSSTTRGVAGSQGDFYLNFVIGVG